MSDKYSGRKEVLLAHGVSCSPTWWEDVKAGSVRQWVTWHPQSGSREREMNTGDQLAFSFLFSLGPQPMEPFGAGHLQINKI